MIFLGIDKGFSAKTRPRHRVGCHRAVVERTNIAKEYAPLAMFALLETVLVMLREQMNLVLLHNHFMSIDDVDTLLCRFAVDAATVEGVPFAGCIVNCQL
jgi:hypothetical protein